MPATMVAGLRAVVIESSIGRRRLDPTKSTPLSIDEAATPGRPPLEWLVHAFSHHGVAEISYVGGYHIEKVIERFPDLHFLYQRDRLRSGEVAALLLYDREPDECLFVHGATLMLPEAVSRLEAGTDEIVVGGLSTPGGFHPLGVIRTRGAGLATVRDTARALAASSPHARLEELARTLVATGCRTVDLRGLAAPTDNTNEVYGTVFRGKAQTLENIKPLARHAIVLDCHRFTFAEWQRDRDSLSRRLAAQLDGTVIVRSSTTSEDGRTHSGAGQFESVLDVPVADRAAFMRAVEAVLASYAANGRVPDPHDEVLVQRQVVDLACSGVMLTRDPRTGGPYYVINVDEASGRSDVVTSGDAGEIVTYFSAWGGAGPKGLPAHCEQLVRLAEELRSLSYVDLLDLEFGITREGKCYLFQVRPQTVQLPADFSDEDVTEQLEGCHAFTAALMRRKPGLYGATTALTTMSDWNPVEMLGSTPRALALALYQYLIGDEAWAKARARIGYRDVRPTPLILSLACRPYVDLRASLNSLMPADLDPEVAGPWADACLARLMANPELQDKIEFEVALTCLAPDWPLHRPRVVDAVGERGADTLEASLRRLTQRVLDETDEPIARQVAQLDQLSQRLDDLVRDAEDGLSAQSWMLRRILDDCRDLGLVPFSILARYAFIAMAILKSLVAVGAISRRQYDAFLQAVPTVAGRLWNDLAAYAAGTVSRNTLIAEYGHLRPNSYEITSPNYADQPDSYLARSAGGAEAANPVTSACAVLAGCEGAIEAAFDKIGLKVDAHRLLPFLAAAISGREEAKFRFMRSVNAALEAIARIGGELGLSRDELSHVPVEEFRRLATDSASTALSAHLRRLSSYNEKRWQLSRLLRLPEVICHPDEVFAFRQGRERPNFITRKHVVAATAVVEVGTPPGGLEGKVVLIEAADPGYDWLFGHNIAGLVTRYGGVASHMAIRAAEFGLPAAIGCGGDLFDTLRRAPYIDLDCEHERVRPRTSR